MTGCEVVLLMRTTRVWAEAEKTSIPARNVTANPDKAIRFRSFILPPALLWPE